MKKAILIILFAVLALSSAWAQEYDFSAVAPTGQTMYYNITSSTSPYTVSVVCPSSYESMSDPDSYESWYGYTEPTGSLTIPSTATYNGTTYAVTAIGSNAFSGCSGLTSVTIPNSVTSIGNNTFFYCIDLTSVTIPNSVTSIGSDAFYGCSGLTSVTIPNSVTAIGSYAFHGCSGLTSVTIPNSVTSIGSHAFHGCSGLTSVTIPNSVTSIGGGAFYGCNGLTSVTIPNSVTSIGSGAFNRVKNIIYHGRASNRSPWGALTVNGYIEGDLIYSDNTKAHLTGCSISATSVTIPNFVTSIGDYAFSDCSHLTSVTIPNSVTSIGNYAFNNCSDLTSVTIPNSVTFIGNYAFSLVKNIIYHGTAGGSPWGALTENGYVEGDLIYTDYTKAYLTGCSISATSISIPNSVTSIGNYAFAGCSGLTSVTIPNSVTAIGIYAFYGCSGLTSVTIPNSVTAIGDEAFYGCSGLTSVVFNARNCSDDYIVCYHAGTGYVSTASPFSRLNLRSVTIGDSVQRIPGSSFYHCSNLTSVTIPNSVTSIGYRAFSGCNSLNNVTIPNSVDSIGDEAFSNCPNLIHITSMRQIAPQTNDNAFNGVPRAAQVYIPCGSSASYMTGWSYFSNFTEQFDLSFQALSNDETMGSVSVVQQPTCSEPAIVEAMPADGYIFSHWSDGATQNPYTLTVTSDTVLTAFFTTTCSPIQPSDLPYFEDFDSYTASTTAKTGVEPSCWTLAHPDVNMTDAFKPMIYYSTAYAHSGRYSLGLLKRGIYAMPEFDGDVSTLQLSMYVRQTQPTYQLIVGVMEDLDDEASFVPVATIDNATTTSELVTVNFRAYTGNGKFIAFRNTNVDASNVYSYNYIDDITLELAPAVPDEPDEPENPCLIRIADLPYSEDFDNYTTSTTTKTGVEPPCWTLAHMDVSMTNSLKPMIYYGAENAHSGNYALNLYKRGIYAMPEFEGNVNTLQMSMYVKQTQLAYQLVVGVMSDLDDESSFVPVATIDNATRTAELVTVDFRSYTGNGKFIAFRNTNADPSNTFSITYIDDITLDANPEVQTYTITADANDDAMGYVLGFGQYAAGSQATLTAVPYDGYRFSHWNDGDVSNPRTFTVTATENLTAYFETAATETNANITMVTVEEGHNKIYWDAVIGAVSYNIYREGAQAGHFTLAGTANANATDWTDMSANANTHSYRYCISYIDSQGVESPLSAPHKTMHLTINKGLDDHTWNLIWSPYEGMGYVSYQIFRGISENNMTCIDVISSDGNITYTDENAPTGTVYYQVAIVWSTSISKGCNDMPKSNIANFVQPFECYTIETTGTTITVTGCENKPVRLYDMAGRLIDSNVNAADVQELQAYSTGIYLVQVDNDPAQKVVVIGR